MITEYQKAILDAFLQVCEENKRKGIQGASATDVCQQMLKNESISKDVIDICDIAIQMKEMAKRGWLRQGNLRGQV